MIKASNLISLDQVKYYLKKLSTDLSNSDLENLQLRFEKEDSEKADDQFIRFFKQKDSKGNDLLINIPDKELFMVCMNKFQIEMVKQLNSQNERIVCMDGTFGLNNKKVNYILSIFTILFLIIIVFDLNRFYFSLY